MTTASEKAATLTVKVKDLRIGDELNNGFIWSPIRAIVPSAIVPGWVVIYYGPLGFGMRLLHEIAEVQVRRAA